MLNTPRRLAFFLPNTFTALNMACGFFSVILGWRGEFYQASMLLVLGAIFDSVDGRVARMTGTQSAFGEQFDSISDVVTFGVAPAFLVYNKFFMNMGRLGLITSFIFLLSGALAIVGLILFTGEYPEAGIMDHPWIAIVYVLFYAFLMISNIPFNSFKNSPWVKSHKKRVLFIIFTILILIVAFHEIMIGGLILLYVLGSLLYFFKNKGALEEMFHWKGEEDDDQGHQI
jgi:CDP-diacylglycerol--serine O-phosphatidyltransferase